MKRLKSSPTKSDLPSDWKEALQAAGFAVSEQPGGLVAVSRSGASATLQANQGQLRFHVPPGILIGSEVAHLIDQGFQKFWKAGERLIPARSVELKSLHDFQRDLRSVLRMTTHYNEALGTVSSSYRYDRLEGREFGKRREVFD